MKKTIIFCILSLIFVFVCTAADNGIQFRMVVSEKEAISTPNDVYSYIIADKPAEKIFVSKEVLLSNVDIKKAVAIKKEDTKLYSPEVRIFFKPDAAKKFEEITGKNIGKRIAVIYNDKLLMVPIIRQTITAGQVSVAGEMIATNEQAEDFAKSLNEK